MKTLCLFAAAAGLTLVSAAPPSKSSTQTAASGGYPPCSKTVTDRCIQLYERGVRSAVNVTRNAKNESVTSAAVARGGPFESASTAIMGDEYPACSASRTDRCTQQRSGSVREARATRKAHHIRQARYVAQAGERG